MYVRLTLTRTIFYEATIRLSLYLESTICDKGLIMCISTHPQKKKKRKEIELKNIQRCRNSEFSTFITISPLLSLSLSLSHTVIHTTYKKHTNNKTQNYLGFPLDPSIRQNGLLFTFAVRNNQCLTSSSSVRSSSSRGQSRQPTRWGNTGLIIDSSQERR